MDEGCHIQGMADKRKRPRDISQRAKLIVDIATMDEDERRALEERLQKDQDQDQDQDQTPGNCGSASPEITGKS